MFYHLLYPLSKYFIVFNVVRYITFRAAYAALTAVVISIVIGPWLIRRLTQFQIGQTIRDEGPAAHKAKAGTPTMGGMLILIAVVVPTLLWADLTNRFVWLALVFTVVFGVIGFADDYLKLARRRSLGLKGRTKILLQIAASLVVALILFGLAGHSQYSTQLQFPFFKQWTPELGWLFVPFAIVVIVGCSNAVNLTDGLDGLAVGTTLIVSATYTVLTYIAGHAVAADYLMVVNVKGVGEVTIFCAALLGASLGFLWFNAYPAQIFMGDMGSLAIGGAVGIVAVLIKQELLLVIAGGLFVVEAMSVIIQVVWFKSTGRRVFLMSPLHHHFELRGWAEPKIVTRFWIVSILFALLSLSTLKLR